MTAFLSKTVGESIEEALRSARIIPAEQEVRSVDYERGLDSANNVLKYWQTRSHLWATKRAVLPLVTGQEKYSLGPTGANCSVDDSFYQTTLGAAASASDTVITVASSSNMVAAPDILTSDPTDSTQDWTALNSATLSVSSGLVITNVSVAGGATYSLETTVGKTYRVRFSYTKGTATGCTFSVLNGSTTEDSESLTSSGSSELTITAADTSITFRALNNSSTNGHTSTVYDVQYVDEESGSYIGIELDDGTRDWGYVLNVDSSTSIDLASGISGAASSGLTVYHYTDQITRPLKIHNVTYGSTYTGSETEVNKSSRQGYMRQTDKDNTGSVNEFYYQPTLTNGTLYTWNAPNSVKSVLRFDYRSPFTVYENSTDSIGIPEEYYMAFKWAIAADLGPEYGVNAERQMILEAKAEKHLSEAEDNDAEDDSIQFEPDL